MRIEVLYVKGCPSVSATLERIAVVLSEHDVSTEIVQTKVTGYDAAQSLRFLGSPSVRINGLDIEPVSMVENRLRDHVPQLWRQWRRPAFSDDSQCYFRGGRQLGALIPQRTPEP